MADRMFGAETEYAISGTQGTEALDRERTVKILLDRARRALRNVPDLYSGGIFLENGSRLYIDRGLHLEYSTAEVTNPWDVVRYIEAGHKTIMGLIQQPARGRNSAVEIGCYRVNVDYSGTHTTWGCHESYLHTMSPEALPADLISHLVTRIVYTGAGGFAPGSGGLRFTLSPRVSHITCTISGDSTHDRGIFHTKDEPLCNARYHRLHVLCGESLCSQLATFLKFGVTSLVVAMAEAGLHPGKDVELTAPLKAMRTVAGDPTCKKQLQVKDSRDKTAVEIQRHYLAMAEAHLGDSFMPPWAPAVCEKWRGVLDLLESGPDAVARMLDWTCKWSLYSHHASSRGLDWERLPVLADAVDCPAESPASGTPTEPADSRRAGRSLQKELHRVGVLRSEFLEIDVRFGQIGPRGLFTQLDHAGVLDHRVPGCEDINDAIQNPPPAGRAKLRGAIVKRVAGHLDAEWCCDWDRIFTPVFGRMCDLSDPFAPTETWVDIDGRPRDLIEAALRERLHSSAF